MSQPVGGHHLRVGLLGGSFNPAHEGHRQLSLMALHGLGLDRVWWLVSPQNPLKPRAGMAALGHRLAGARALVGGDRRFVVTDLEQALATRFTLDTVRRLKQLYPGARFVWLMGADNLIQAPRWHRWGDLFATVPIAVIDRPTYACRALAGPAATRFRGRRVAERDKRALADRTPPAWVFLRWRTSPASATAIRAGGAGSPVGDP